MLDLPMALTRTWPGQASINNLQLSDIIIIDNDILSMVFSSLLPSIISCNALMS